MDFRYIVETTWAESMKQLVPLVILTLVFLGVGALSLGILAPVCFAGYTRSILMMVREGREPKPMDLFSRMNLFLPLLGFGAAVFVAVALAAMLLVLPGIIVSLAILFCTIYMFPLLVDRDMGVIEAVKESYAMAVGGNIYEHIVVVALYAVVNAVGGSLFIASLATLPLATVFLVIVYDMKKNPA